MKASEAIAQKMFSKETLIEISTDEDGFEGAWFAATIVEAVGLHVPCPVPEPEDRR